MELIELIRTERADPPSGIRTMGLDRTHRWITELAPGRVVMAWLVDDLHDNLEGAVICSWLVAIADQALFFASNTLCGEGEGTRTEMIALASHHNVTGGTVQVAASIDDREGDQMAGSCSFTLEDGTLAATVTATISIHR